MKTQDENIMACRIP